MSADGDAPLPFIGGWIGWFGYDLGRAIEPAAAGTPRAGSAADRRWPLAEWHRCPAAYIHDGWTGRWWLVGEPGAAANLPRPADLPPPRPAPISLGPLESGMGREVYEAAVAAGVEHIHAGDIFQVNLAHRLSGAFSGSARGCFVALARAARPWYGAYLERAAEEGVGVRRIIASISPELFLEYDARTRRVVTRPIKGTRRAGAAEERELLESGKDAAELVMIVDLMRNDLGRVAEVGSVRVDELRTLERHGGSGGGGGGSEGDRVGTGVWHGVATVSARLREGSGLADLLRASFPAGSITGAPKIRAMQIIDDLEPAPRGPYCGSIGYISDCGNACFNVAIRTACLSGPVGRGGCGCDEMGEGSVLDYSVGAGIVAESEPAKEWQETLDKAGVILRLAGAGSQLMETRA